MKNPLRRILSSSRISLLAIFLIALNLCADSQGLYHATQHGYVMKLWLGDNGEIGWGAGQELVWYSNLDIPIYGCQYPVDSYYEHLDGGGLWVGALENVSPTSTPRYVKRVTTADETDSSGGTAIPSTEMLTVDTITPWLRFSTTRHDSGALSEDDLVCTYSDTGTQRYMPYHHPLGVKVIQRSMSWANGVRGPILPIQYELINLGTKKLKDIYIGWHLYLAVGPSDGTQIDYRDIPTTLGYWPELLTVYVQNPIYPGSTPVGFTVLNSPSDSGLVKYRFRWLKVDNQTVYGSQYAGAMDSLRYNFMSGVNPPNLPDLESDPPPTDISDHMVLLSFGPFASWAPSETLKCTFAIVGGLSLKTGSDNVYDNAKFAQNLAARNFVPPVILPAPKLRIKTGHRSATLDWGYDGAGPDPENYWDDANQLIKLFPPDHWRRVNPPLGHTTGGRVFDGYRLYRSEDPTGVASSFTLLEQWDVKDSIGPKLGYGTGIQTTFVDTNLVPEKVYWYAVTSFGIPDAQVLTYPDRDGSFKAETLYTPSLESSLLAARKRVQIPFATSSNLNKVLVVPNPYRTDQNYTFENGGWEGREQSWTENNRLLKFINLPSRCTIRIFSLVGDIVKTIEHDDPTRGEENWNLLSESGRTVASGVFIFTVESEFGTQTGKFVIIR